MTDGLDPDPRSDWTKHDYDIDGLETEVLRLQAIVDKLLTWCRRIDSASDAIGCSSAHTGPARTEISRVTREMSEAAKAKEA